jgi:macrolide transport system ATP-binding/permease protein
MTNLRSLVSRLRGTVSGRSEDQQMDAEIAAHLEMLRERYKSRGYSATEADRLAHLQFGSVTVLKERQRSVRGYLAPTEWGRDIRFALRMLRKNWLSNMAVVLALALGIGMNGAVFTFVNALLLRPPEGVSATGTLMEIWLDSRTGSGIQSYLPFNYPDYFYYRAHQNSFDGLLAFDGDGAEAIWNQSGYGQTIRGQLVSGNFFSILDVSSAVGRTLTAQDDRIEDTRRAIVLSHAFWKAHMNGDPQVVGRGIFLNGSEFTIVGVAPARFSGLLIGSEPDFWAPLGTQEIFTRDKSRIADRNGFWLIVAGRLRPGVHKAQAQAELQLLSRQLDQLYPDALNHVDPLLYPANLVPGPYRGYVGAFTGLLLAVFLLVLLIACTNAAGLLLARATGRTREMAIRTALGARRSRLVMQILVESLLLSGLAGAAAIGISWTAARILIRLKPASIPVTVDLTMDWRVLLFIFFVAVTAGLLFGLIPAMRGSAVNPAPVLKEEMPAAGVHKSRLRLALLVGEIALSVVLLTGASLCVRSLLHASSINPGFDTHNIALATLNAGSLGYSAEQANDFYDRYLERIRRVPGVTSASYTDFLPLGSASSQTSAGTRIGDDRVGVQVFRVDTRFFATMGIPLLAGRDFTGVESRQSSAYAAAVNETLARRLWPGQNPIGKHLWLGGDKTTCEVIAVVRDGKYRTLGEMPAATVYRTGLPPQRTIVVRTSSGDRSVVDLLQRAVQEVDSKMVATHVQTIQDYMALPLFPARAAGLLLGASGILALVLTTIGLFGVIAYLVSQRTHEIGLRIALGARRIDVLRLVLRQGLSVTIVGLGIGLAGAFAVSRLLTPLLYGIRANDAATLAEVCLGLAMVAVLACYLPARRAMRIDPASALRYE